MTLSQLVVLCLARLALPAALHRSQYCVALCRCVQALLAQDGAKAVPSAGQTLRRHGIAGRMIAQDYWVSHAMTPLFHVTHSSSQQHQQFPYSNNILPDSLPSSITKASSLHSTGTRRTSEIHVAIHCTWHTDLHPVLAPGALCIDRRTTHIRIVR